MDGKEGGYGWCVTAASFLLHAVVGGVVYSCGAFHFIFHRYFNHDSHLVTSWLGAALMGTTVLAGIPGTWLSYRLGLRPVVILGGLLAASGFIMSAFLHQFYQVLLTFGIVTGFGLGLAVTPAVLILNQYFYTERGTSVAIATTGSSLGMAALPMATYYLEDWCAWQGMSLIYAGLCLNICLCGVVMKPPGTGSTYRERAYLLTIFKPAVLGSPSFLALCWCNLLWSIGSVIMYVYLPEYATTQGMTPEEGITLLAVVGMAAVVCRPIFGMLSQSAKLDHTSIMLCTTGFAVILTGLFPELFKHKAGQIGYALILGLHASFWMTFVAYVSGDDVVGEAVSAHGRGFTLLAVSLGMAAGGPLAGWVLDQSGDYEIVFYLAGSCLLLSSVLLSVVNFRRCPCQPDNDWCETDSESSSGSSRTAPNICAEEASLVGRPLSLEIVFDPLWLDAKESVV